MSSILTLYKTFNAYKILFKYLDLAKEKLAGKDPAWKNALGEAIDAATKKLMKYYSQTYTRHDLGKRYAFARLLHPGQHRDNKDLEKPWFNRLVDLNYSNHLS